MGAPRRLARIKGALLEVLRECYVRRDPVGIVAFRDGDAPLLLEPGAPLERAPNVIRSLAAGGRTPLAAGFVMATRLIEREVSRDPNRRSIVMVLTDWRVTSGRGEITACARRLGAAASAVHIIDVEEAPARRPGRRPPQ
jgi:magnesium chelatase subunit D